MTTRTIIAVLLATALAGCDLTATAEADSVCVKQPLPAVNTAGAGGDFDVATNVALDLGGALPDLDQKGVTAELIAQSIAITSADGSVDLTGIQRATVTASAAGKPPITFEYVKPAGATGVRSLVAVPSARVNLVEYLEGSETLRISAVRASGTAPAQTWTPALRTCASTKIEVDYLKAAGN